MTLRASNPVLPRAPIVLVVLVVLVVLASFPARARPCATLGLLELSRRGDGLTFAVGVGDRPADATVVQDSASAPVRVHAVPAVPQERVLFLLGVLETAWDAQVTRAGFPPPLPDGQAGGDERFDVYLAPLPDGLGGVTIAGPDANPSDGRHASPSFLQLDPTLRDDLLEVYAWHELQHALQFSIDVEESLMWFESTAVFWEVRARPDVDDWIGGVADFQSQPQAPLFGTGASIEDIVTSPAPRYEYGAALFALYLDEVHGDGAGTVLAEIWQQCSQSDDVDQNEPDFLDAMVASGIPPAGAVADFVGWRALVGPFAVDDDGPREPLPAAALLQTRALNAATLDGTPDETNEEEGPWPLGCVVRSVDAPANVDVMPVEIEASATAAGREIALATLVLDIEAHTAARAVTSIGPRASASLGVARGETLQIAICDASAADPDDATEHRPVRISVRRTDVQFPDAGPPPRDAGPPADVDGGPSPDEESGCGCQSTSTGPSSGDPRRMRSGLGVLGLLLGLFGFGVRGFRVWRRKRLYQRE